MDQAAEVALEVFRAIEERDRDRLFALYRDEIEFHESEALPYGGFSKGKEHLWRQLEHSPETTWLGSWGPVQPTADERAMSPEVLHSEGGRVVVGYSLRGLSSTGERFEAPVIGAYRIRDGLLARAQMFHYDTGAITAFLRRAEGGAQRSPS